MKEKALQFIKRSFSLIMVFVLLFLLSTTGFADIEFSDIIEYLSDKGVLAKTDIQNVMLYGIGTEYEVKKNLTLDVFFAIQLNNECFTSPLYFIHWLKTNDNELSQYIQIDSTTFIIDGNIFDALFISDADQRYCYLTSDRIDMVKALAAARDIIMIIRTDSEIYEYTYSEDEVEAVNTLTTALLSADYLSWTSFAGLLQEEDYRNFGPLNVHIFNEILYQPSEMTIPTDRFKTAIAIKVNEVGITLRFPEPVLYYTRSSQKDEEVFQQLGVYLYDALMQEMIEDEAYLDSFNYAYNWRVRLFVFDYDDDYSLNQEDANEYLKTLLTRAKLSGISVLDSFVHRSNDIYFMCMETFINNIPLYAVNTFINGKMITLNVLPTTYGNVSQEELRELVEYMCDGMIIN